MGEVNLLRGVGIYIGKKHVVGAVVVRSGAGFRIDHYAVESIQQGISLPESAAGSASKKATPESAAIRVVMEKIRARGSFVRVGISPFHVVTRYFIMPSLPSKEKDEAVRYEASRYTHMKLTESVFGYTESQHVPNVVSITANAVKRRVIQSTLISLRHGYAEPETIEPDYVPFSRACAALGFGDFKSANVLIWFDSDGSVNVSLVAKQIVFLAQDFKLGGGAEQDREKIRDELHGSFRFLNENAGGAQVKNVLIAGFGDLEGWAEFLTNSFPSLHLEVLRLPMPAGADTTYSGALVLAFGLGIGELGVKSPLGEVTLLPPEDKKLRPQYLAAAFAAAAAAILIFLFLISVFIVTPIHHGLEQKKTRAEEPLMSYGTIALEPFSSVETRASALATRLTQLEKFEKSRVPLKEVLYSVAVALPQSIWLQRIALEAAPAQVNVAGESVAVTAPQGVTSLRFVFEGFCYAANADTETKQINAWVQSLANNTKFSSHFKNIAVDEVQQKKVFGRNTTHFTVTAGS